MPSPRLLVASTLLILLSSALPTGLLAETVTLDTPQGTLLGESVGEGAAVRVFRGIPYALPPVGVRRWRPPEPAPGWTGLRDATAFAPACVQPPYPSASFFSRPSSIESEDCLYLNVWTAASPGEARPVMVWIHGGGLTRGTGATVWYDGTRLAEKGAVVVTINYRLGVFGFTAHPELTAESKHASSGNYGILDQVRALEWVRDQIAAFGGDPERVTVFGESAGSWSVNALQATPLSKGLFHRAIGQSGGRFGPMHLLRESAHGQPAAEQSGIRLQEALKVDSLADLRALPAHEILAAWQESGQYSQPNVDGWVFPDHVGRIFAAGRQHDVPVIVGYNADEGTTLVLHLVPPSAEVFEERVRELYGQATDRVLALYPSDDPRRSFLAVYRDGSFGWNMHRWAREMAHVESPAYLYFFTQHPPGPPEQRSRLGAYHAAEIRYVFGNWHLLGDQVPPEDRRLAELMADAWVRFAATGDPNVEGLPDWRPYTPERRHYLELGAEPVPGEDLAHDAIVLFDAIDAARWQSDEGTP